MQALLDRGSFVLQGKHNLVPVGALDYNTREPVIDEQRYLLTARVIETLTADAVLGWDLPLILDLLLEAEKTEGTYYEERG